MNTSTNTASVVIPVLNAEAYLEPLLKALSDQIPAPPHEIILVDSGSTDRTLEIAEAHPDVRVVTIAKFTHGGSRNLGASEAVGDIVVFLTQDALPRDHNWLRGLLAALEDPEVVTACSRQIPYPNATPMECFFLQKRFPEAGETRNLKTLNGDTSYEKILFSDVSCAIRRSVLLENPFDETLIMSEDQQLARDLILKGHTMVYAPESVVVHSHRYTLVQTLRRYFDSVCALMEIFPDQQLKGSARMGIRYIKEETGYLLRRAPLWLMYYPAYVGVKTLATLLAHNRTCLPKWLLRRISMHSYHWAQ